MSSDVSGPHIVPKGVLFDSWGRPYHSLRDPQVADDAENDGSLGGQVITVEEAELSDAKPCSMVTVQRLVRVGTPDGPISAYPPRAFQASWSGLTDQGDEQLDELIYGGVLNGVLATDVTRSMVLKQVDYTSEIHRRLGLPEATEDKLERQAHDRARGIR